MNEMKFSDLYPHLYATISSGYMRVLIAWDLVGGSAVGFAIISDALKGLTLLVSFIAVCLGCFLSYLKIRKEGNSAEAFKELKEWVRAIVRIK